MKKILNKVLEILLFIIACLYLLVLRNFDISDETIPMIMLMLILATISSIFVYTRLYKYLEYILTSLKNMDKCARKKVKSWTFQILKVVFGSIIAWFLITYFNTMFKLFGLKVAVNKVLIFITPVLFWYVILRVFRDFFSKVGRVHRIVKQIDKSDFNFEKEYYREILKETSPLILGYIDNFDIDKNKLIAEIIYLEKNGLIKISDDKLVTLLSLSEQISEY